MGSLLHKVGSPLVLIAGLIFIHELGHFLMAKLFKVKVVRFSIGFGPRLLGWTVGETEYLLAAIPLGGYVKMAGDDPTEPLTGADAGRGFLEQAPWKRALIAGAGPFMSLAFPVIIYFFIYAFQTQGVSSLLGNVDPDSAAWTAGLRSGDRVIEADGKPVSYFTELKDYIGPRYDKSIHLKVQKASGAVVEVDVTPRKITEKVDMIHEGSRGVLGVMSPRPAPFVAVPDPTSPAGVAGLHTFDRITHIGGQQIKYFSDVELALAKASGPTQIEYLRPSLLPLPGANLSSLLPGTVTVNIDEATHNSGIESVNNVIDAVDPGSPAELAGLKRFDKILSANGKPLLSWTMLERIRSESKGTPIALEVLRDGQKQTLTVTQKAHEVKDELGQPLATWQFGAVAESTNEPSELIPLRYSAGHCLALALNEVPKNIGIVAGGLWGMVNGKVALDQVGGPGMLYDIASRSSEAGATSFFAAMAIISINLGIMNLLPIPVLDGFHILSAAFEWIRRRPLSLRAREYANMVGLVMLLGLMAFALKNDFVRYVLN